MKSQGRLSTLTVLLLCGIIGGATLTAVGQGRQRDPLAFLKRALTEASAPALTTDQETQLNTLITDFRNAEATNPDDTLQMARAAYNTAILAGDLAAAQAQAAVIANRTAELTTARLRARAQFAISVLAVLKSGGQLEPLTQKFGSERLLGLVDALVGGGGRGGFGPGPR